MITLLIPPLFFLSHPFCSSFTLIVPLSLSLFLFHSLCSSFTLFFFHNLLLLQSSSFTIFFFHCLSPSFTLIHPLSLSFTLILPLSLFSFIFHPLSSRFPLPPPPPPLIPLLPSFFLPHSLCSSFTLFVLLSPSFLLSHSLHAIFTLFLPAYPPYSSLVLFLFPLLPFSLISPFHLVSSSSSENFSLALLNNFTKLL